LQSQDQQFDWVFVSDGLHHCSRPHAALLEMYRVCKKGIIVVESRDNLLMRLATRLGIADEYEVRAVRTNGGHSGGVDNTSVPNYVFRWTERELKKTLRSFDPSGPQAFRFYSTVSIPDRLTNPILRGVAERVAQRFKSRGNTFAMVATRPSAVWPWLEVRDGDVVFRSSDT
jgi:hypothetical protein